MSNLREYMALLEGPSLPAARGPGLPPPVRNVYDIVPPPGTYGPAYAQTLAWLRGRSSLHPLLIEVARRFSSDPQRFGASLLEAAGTLTEGRAFVAGVSADAVRGVANALVVRNNDPDARAQMSRG